VRGAARAAGQEAKQLLKTVGHIPQVETGRSRSTAFLLKPLAALLGGWRRAVLLAWMACQVPSASQ
jgi:hypothetical protein